MQAGAGDTFTALIAEEGVSDPIPIRAGLRQGCPLSGLPFNLVVDPIIRDVQGEAEEHNILAYADDLTLLASSPSQLQHRINRVEALTTSLVLVALNLVKCTSLHMSGVIPVGMRPIRVTILGVTISFSMHADFDGPHLSKLFILMHYESTDIGHAVPA
ncbi:hypothetical protein MTO96_037364 [Rhipicephalus appendiculatus]